MVGICSAHDQPLRNWIDLLPPFALLSLTDYCSLCFPLATLISIALSAVEQVNPKI